MPSYKVKNPKELGQVIQSVREARGVSQQELAESLAIDRLYQMRLETGKPTLYVSRLFRVLRKLEITVTVTFGTGAGPER